MTLFSEPIADRPPLDARDREELAKLVNAVALSDRSLTLFAIAPDSAPNHPATLALRTELEELEEPLEFLKPLYYSDTYLFEFLHELENPYPLGAGAIAEPAIVESPRPLGAESGQHRRVIMAFGLERMSKSRLQREMEQLNLGRERIFDRNLVLVFWLNRATFLDEFRRQAADFWDWHGKVAQFTTRPPLEPLLYPYLEWTIAENSHLRVSGVMQVNRQVDILLDRIYVSLEGKWEEERSSSFRDRLVPGSGRARANRFSPSKLDPEFESEFASGELPMRPEAIAESRQRVTRTADLAEAVRDRAYCAILGDPGAGKTTLLRYLARHFAIAYRDRNAQAPGGQGEDLGETRLPIWFRIADFAERLAKQPDLTLVAYLKQFYRHWEDRCAAPSDGEAIATLLLDKMAEGKCLLLLDGLDEVFDRANRVQVVRQIETLVDAYRNNKFVVTSRIAGYQEAALGGGFREFTIAPMDESRIEQFLQRWCLAIEGAQRPDADAVTRDRDAEREAKGILAAIATKPGVKRFATNPLLLTILALIHRNGTQLPQRRVELYELAAKTLIEDWQLGRNVPYGARQPQLVLREEEVTELLAPLAFWMHEEVPTGAVAQERVEEWMTPRMAELQGIDEATALALVRQFLRKVRETTGLFVERAPAVYGFMHLTFEEYFAARHIADNEIPEILEIINEHRYQSRWNEPILLALGYLSRDRRRIDRLVKQLFRDLDAYDPAIADREMRLKHASSERPVLVWCDSASEEEQESDAVWQDLLFVGQVLSEVNVSPVFCRRQVEKLVRTYVALDLDYDDEPKQELLRLLRGIEVFNRQVLARLEEAIADESLSQEQQDRAWVAVLYVLCGSAELLLSDRPVRLFEGWTPALFDETLDLVKEMGAEMTPALERSLENENLGAKHRQILEFIIGLSYLRSKHWDLAIARLEPLINRVDCLNGYVRWASAIAHQGKENYKQASEYYQQCSEKVRSFILWRNWGWCYRLHKQYEQSLACFQQALEMTRQLGDRKAEANILWNIGRSYKDWSKYEEAISYYERSRDLYQKLDDQTNVANQWFWLGDCYKDWSKYKKAMECQQQCLELRKLEENRSRVALSLYQLGRIYQDWSKYEEAISYYEQSRDLYQQLDKQTNVANQWFWLGDCYKDWSKYKKAMECQQQCLELRKLEEDRSRVALSLYQLGCIYQDWSKYEEAISYYEQSRDLYQRLDKQAGIADQWDNLADCYQKWGKYKQALVAAQKGLAIYKKIGDQSNIAISYWRIGYIHQNWDKNKEAITHYKQSCDLYQQLNKEINVATQWFWIGNCYQDWGKYEEAITHHEQSRDLYQQLDRETDVANRWYTLAGCYCEWGKYEQALAAEQKDLAIRQKLDEQRDIADAYYQFGRIYQAWSRCEKAIAHHHKSKDLYEAQDIQHEVAYQFSQLASCYRDLKDYTTAIDYYQKSCNLYQALELNEMAASRSRQLSNTQRQYAQTLSGAEAATLLQQAHQNLDRTLHLDTQGDYRHNLAYDRISQALLIAASLPPEAPNDAIAQFERTYTDGFDRLTALGREVRRAEEALDIARAYLETPALANFDRAERIARQSLQTFQDFNRRKLQAAARKLLGEIYCQRDRNGEAGAIAIGDRFLLESLQLYRDLDLTQEVEEVEALRAQFLYPE